MSVLLEKAKAASRRSRARADASEVRRWTHTHTHIVHAVCFVASAFVLCVRASSTLHSFSDDFTEWRGSPPSFCRRHPVAWRAQISSRYRRPRGRADMVLKVLLRGAWRRAAAVPRNSSAQRFSYISTGDGREAGMREGGDRGREEGRRGKGKEGGRERQAEERGEKEMRHGRKMR